MYAPVTLLCSWRIRHFIQFPEFSTVTYTTIFMFLLGTNYYKHILYLKHCHKIRSLNKSCTD